MDELTAFQRDALYVIAGLGEPNGLEIKTELDKYYSKEIHHGRLYPNLDTLVDKGLVQKGTHDRRTNAYELTERGERETTHGASGKPSMSQWTSSGFFLRLLYWQPEGFIL